jgi:hypothetical protein
VNSGRIVRQDMAVVRVYHWRPARVRAADCNVAICRRRLVGQGAPSIGDTAGRVPPVVARGPG